MGRPNVIFLVWDACRLDYATREAETLRSLAAENLWFERAIASSGWSLPSHMSMFSGEYPSDHGIYSINDTSSNLPLVQSLNQNRYDTYGLSANGFASPSYGFSNCFDEFYSTHEQMIFLDGLDVHQYYKEVVDDNEGDFRVSLPHLLKSIVTHPHTIKSTINVAAAAVSRLSTNHPLVNKLPLKRLNHPGQYCVDPNKNTETIKSIINSSAQSERPFFIFANYMSTHRPYNPPDQIQEEIFGEVLPFEDIKSVNNVTHPFKVAGTDSGGFPFSTEDLDTITDLYRGEIRSLDTHLKRIVGALRDSGQLDNTLIVVTADHGEMFFESDCMDERWFGHESSASDHLYRVPLLIANPGLDSLSVHQWVPTKNIYNVLSSNLGLLLNNSNQIIEDLLPRSKMVFGEYPADGRAPQLKDQYPGVPIELFSRDLVIGFKNEWKIAVTSNDRICARKGGDDRRVDSAPDELVEECLDRLGKFSTQKTSTGISEDRTAHLEQLGYL